MAGGIHFEPARCWREGEVNDWAVRPGMSTGELWIENTKGVVNHLDAKREGLALALGADVFYVDFK